MEATTKDLRLNTAALLSATDRGETVVITYRGQRRAVMYRWDADERTAATGTRNPVFGLWADRDEDVAEQVRRLRQGRQLP